MKSADLPIGDGVVSHKALSLAWPSSWRGEAGGGKVAPVSPNSINLKSRSMKREVAVPPLHTFNGQERPLCPLKSLRVALYSTLGTKQSRLKNRRRDKRSWTL